MRFGDGGGDDAGEAGEVVFVVRTAPKDILEVPVMVQFGVPTKIPMRCETERIAIPRGES